MHSCAQAITLHFYAPRHRSMVAKASKVIEYKRAKQDGREPDYRWGEVITHVDVDPPTQGSQCPAEDPQPQCAAAAATMHGSSRGASSSWQGGCPTIAEHQEWYPPVQSQHVIWPNPGYKIEANLWHLNVQESARRPGPLHLSFVIAILWTVHTFQAMEEVVHSQQTTLSILIAMLQWRIFVNFRSIARSFNLKRHVFVYGPIGFKTRSWMSKRKSRHGLQA